ncbi:MAG: bifunctional phosphoglucose/phosphomannose isomerase [Candidatus Wildermuthbacteria bacterium]|nr:bifunctional phosphoglucose/phosphomannose isomerase [Candidatus Wildermuthbacteria bacterium]
MEKAIREFAKQFAWEPFIENEHKLRRTGKYILAGMGGSHLQGDLFQTIVPGFDLSVHQDYGLPSWPMEVLEKALVIASSYSGNTEETLSVFREAIVKGVPVAAISIGGQLLDLAKQYRVPFIQMPDTGIQPRMALGFSFKALARVMGQRDVEEQAAALASKLEVDSLEQKGKALAERLKGKIPLMYSSQRNYAIAYNWKIKFNETGKIPAFYNVFPELNHNEMTGFDAKENTRQLSHNFYCIILRDRLDHPKILKRMDILQKLYAARGLSVENINMEGLSTMERTFSSLLCADWAAYHLALYYGVEPEKVPMVEEFKRLIA